MRPEEQVSRKGESFGCLRLNCTASLQLGGGGGGGGGGVVDFERVNVSHLGASWGMLPRKILILSPPKWLEMHLKLKW